MVGLYSVACGPGLRDCCRPVLRGEESETDRNGLHPVRRSQNTIHRKEYLLRQNREEKGRFGIWIWIW